MHAGRHMCQGVRTSTCMYTKISVQTYRCKYSHLWTRFNPHTSRMKDIKLPYIHQMTLGQVAANKKTLEASIINLHSHPPPCIECTGGDATDVIVPNRERLQAQVSYWKCSFMHCCSEYSDITKLFNLLHLSLLPVRIPPASPLCAGASVYLGVCLCFVFCVCALHSSGVYVQRECVCGVINSVFCEGHLGAD